MSANPFCLVADPAAESVTATAAAPRGRASWSGLLRLSLYLWLDGPAARHPYGVLVQAMQQRRKWALACGVLSTRRMLALVRPAGRLLAVHVLHFPAQLRSSAGWEADLQAGAASSAEE